MANEITEGPDGTIPFMPLSGFATMILGKKLPGLRLDLFPSVETLGETTTSIQVAMTPDQAEALGQALLRVAAGAREIRPAEQEEQQPSEPS